MVLFNKSSLSHVSSDFMLSGPAHECSEVKTDCWSPSLQENSEPPKKKKCGEKSEEINI